MLLLGMGFNAGDRWSPQSSFIVCVCGGGFTANLDCFQCSSLPEATCCPVDPYFLPVNAVVGGICVLSARRFPAVTTVHMRASTRDTHYMQVACMSVQL